MGEVEEYPHGTFCWVDLGTPGVDDAKRFYGGLLGWEFEDLPGGPDGAYTMCLIDGHDVAGIHPHPETEGAEWSSYISVHDVDAATDRAHELDADVLLEPFDIPGTARMSLLRDPTGAVVSLWQETGHPGAGLVNDIGAWCWNELVTPDLDAARAFYSRLLGWEAEGAGDLPRATLTLGDLLIGGMHTPFPGENDAPRWAVSFAVEDADASATEVERLGGRVVLPPMDVPVGRFAVVADPAGAELTITSFPGGPVRGVDGS